jgi:hypothetical protein
VNEDVMYMYEDDSMQQRIEKDNGEGRVKNYKGHWKG